MKKTYPLAIMAAAFVAACGDVATESALPLTGPSASLAAVACAFNDDGTTLTLLGDCTTTQSILIPDGYTLEGAGYTITAVDPSGDRFRGAIVRNGGASAHVINVVLRTDGLANVCSAAAPQDDRLRGVLFEGASGSIQKVTVLALNKVASGCQEGNAIEVRKAPFDGTHPATATVSITHNSIADYQKTGIVVNGDVSATIEHNQVGASATQQNLAANSIQVGFGAQASVKHNKVDGNQWRTASAAATAVLLYESGHGTEVSLNNIDGNSDVGIYIWADGVTAFNNQIDDVGADIGFYDIGIGNYAAYNAGVGPLNDIVNNKVRGFDLPYDEVDDESNKVRRANPSE